MFRNMKVGSRLALGFILVLGFMAAIIGVGLRQAQVSQETLERIVDINRGRVQLAHDMIDDARETAIAVRDILLATHTTPSSERLQEMRDRLAELRRTYAGSAATIKKTVAEDDSKGLDLFNKLEASGVAARQLQDQVIEWAVAGKHAEAVDLMNGRAYPTVKQWISETDDFIQHNKERAALHYNQVVESAHLARTIMFIFGAAAVALSVVIVTFLTLGITRPLAQSVRAADRIASGDLTLDLSAREKRGDEVGALIQSFSQMVAALRDAANQADVISRGNYSAEVEPRSDKDVLGIALQRMTRALRDNRDHVQRQDWLKTGIARLNQVMSGDPDLTALASKAISELTTYLDAQVGALYVAQDGNGSALSLMGSYAYTKRKNLSNVFKPGEGLVGQAALEKQPILLKNVPEDYVKVTSALGERVPRFICVSPFINEGRVKGVIEVGTLNEMTDQQMEYLKQVMPAIALAVESAESRTKLTESLEESQSLTEELQAQQEELKTANEELEQQTQRLKESEEELKAQQVELQVTNEELEEKNELLGRQKRDVEKAGKDVEKQAEELALASKYKSEFLANMSHELRTPLNSLLLLSGLLAENKNGNLTPDQVETARVIHNGGMNLLSLINEILDLAKIEAGRMDLDLGTVPVSDLAGVVRDVFQRLAGEKGLDLDVNVADGVPDRIVTDRKRVEQIIGNLVSNAVKFTEKGGVTVTFRRPADGADLSRSGLSPDGALAIEVKDTGIGISPEKHAVIFKAFRQADGSTTRQYGDTGLGLSISTQLARLLGGEISLESEPGRGSTFTAYLPIAAPAAQGAAAEPAAPAAGAASPPPDSQAAPDASAAGRRPTEQVPDDRDALKEGDRVCLVIEDDPKFAEVLRDQCRQKGFRCIVSPTGEGGLALARQRLPAAVILDLGLPDMNDMEFLDSLVRETGSRPPVIVCTARDLTREQERDLREQAASIVLKDGRFEERLLDEVSLFLHRVAGNMPERKRRTIAGPHNGDPALEGAKVLIVDDDTGTLFALSQLLADHGVRVLKAEDGDKALRVLQQEPDVDLVLMDIMMPVMDGYEAIGKIRAQDKFRNLPIIALTAKAMAEDRQRCLTAGASDYLPKPLDEGRLISMMRVWLYRKQEALSPN
jgi:signal transduction histidine kinase/DNA-binding response OmpR family regulator/HAMP domain-containing protein